MTAQESREDLDKVKQAFVEILLRKLSETGDTDEPVESLSSLFVATTAGGDEDDPLDSVASLFEEPASAAGEDGVAGGEDGVAGGEDGVAGAAEGAEDAEQDEDTPQDADATEDAGATDEDDDPLGSVAALFAEPAEVAAPAAGGSPEWKEFLATFGTQWNGKKEGWRNFREWIEIFAKDRGVTDEALMFLNAAEAEQDIPERIKFFARHGVVIDSDKADKSEFEKPTTDADGRAVQTILSTEKSSDGGGDYLWVRVDDEVGKIYLKGRKFVAEENKDFAEIPLHDVRGRKIEEVEAKKAGADYVVRIRDVWGRINPTTGKFLALRPDDSAYADWSMREITRDGYSEGGSPVNGEWFKPWEDQSVYLFLRVGDVREWARGAQLTGTVPGSTQLTVDFMLKDWAKPYDNDKL